MGRDADGEPRGFTANSFSSVSLRPPLVSICIDRNIASFKVFGECTGFSINVLVDTQREISNLFASRSRDKFANLAWRTSEITRAPRLAESVAWFDCVPFKQVDAGDHMILIGEVVDFGYSDKAPLSFCRGNYISFSLMQDVLSQQSQHKLCIGCVLNKGSSVLLVPEKDGWTLPTSDSLGTRDVEAGLYGVLKGQGIGAELNFIFSVFDGPLDGQLSVFYRGEIANIPESPAEGARLFPYDEIPWEALQYDAYRSMLSRYIDERRRFQFGIYVGSSETGAVVASPSASDS